MKNLGDFTAGKTISCRFNTHKADGTPITLAGTPAVSVYKTGSTTESTAGVSLTVDYDSRTGKHYVEIDTSADGTFYSAGADYDITITAGTVDSISVVGTVVGTFSLANRAALRPTAADRTLDVSAGGEAGVDWANVGTPGSTVALSATTISLGTNAPAGWLNTSAFADNALTAAKFASGAFDAVWTVTVRTLSTAGVQAIWDAATSALTTAGSIGKRIVDYLTGDVYARLGAPAGASIAADISSVLSSVQGLNNLSALANIYGSPLLEIPDSGSTDFAFTVVVRDNEGKLVDLDASPTIAASNAAGTSRSANLSAVSHPATGRYTFTYSVASSATEESLRITVSGAVSAESRYVEWIGAVVDYDTLTTLSSVATQVNAIHGKLPSKAYLAGTNNSDGDIQLDEATGGLPADSITASSYDELTAFPVVSADSGSTRIARTGADSDTLESLSDQLDAVNTDTAAILLDTGTDGVVVAAGSKTGYSLASTGLDSIAVTAPSVVATTFPGMVVQLWRRFFKRATKTSTQIKTYADDGTTVVTTQTVSDDGTTETQGAAS